MTTHEFRDISGDVACTVDDEQARYEVNVFVYCQTLEARITKLDALVQAVGEWAEADRHLRTLWERDTFPQLLAKERAWLAAGALMAAYDALRGPE